MDGTSAHVRYLHARLTRLIDWADTELDDENTDRQYLLEDLLRRLSELAGEIRPTDPDPDQ